MAKKNRDEEEEEENENEGEEEDDRATVVIERITNFHQILTII